MSKVIADTIQGRAVGNEAPDCPKGLTATGIITATSFSGDGSALTGVGTDNIATASLTVSGITTYYGDIHLQNGVGVGNSVTWDTSANSLIFKDGSYAKFGDGSDLHIYHNGNNSFIDNNQNDLYIQTTGSGDDIIIQANDDILLQPQAGEDGITIVGDAEVKIYYNGSKKLETTNDGVVITGICTDSKGDVRSVPRNSKSSAYVLIASDHGKCITITTGGVTINPSVMKSGDIVTIINDSGSNQTITQGSSMTLYDTGDDGSTGNKTLKGRGMCTVWFTSDNNAYITGNFD